jgi:hypothetical protein
MEELLSNIIEVRYLNIKYQYLEHTQFKSTVAILQSEALELKGIQLESGRNDDAGYEKVTRFLEFILFSGPIFRCI